MLPKRPDRVPQYIVRPWCYPGAPGNIQGRKLKADPPQAEPLIAVLGFVKKANRNEEQSDLTITSCYTNLCALRVLCGSHNPAKRQRQTNPTAPKCRDHPHQIMMTGARPPNICPTHVEGHQTTRPPPMRVSTNPQSPIPNLQSLITHANYQWRVRPAVTSRSGRLLRPSSFRFWWAVLLLVAGKLPGGTMEQSKRLPE